MTLYESCGFLWSGKVEADLRNYEYFDEVVDTVFEEKCGLFGSGLLAKKIKNKEDIPSSWLNGKILKERDIPTNIPTENNDSNYNIHLEKCGVGGFFDGLKCHCPEGFINMGGADDGKCEPDPTQPEPSAERMQELLQQQQQQQVNPAEREGCTKQTAINYDPMARIDDGSCKYMTCQFDDTTSTETTGTGPLKRMGCFKLCESDCKANSSCKWAESDKREDCVSKVTSDDGLKTCYGRRNDCGSRFLRGSKNKGKCEEPKKDHNGLDYMKCLYKTDIGPDGNPSNKRCITNPVQDDCIGCMDQKYSDYNKFAVKDFNDVDPSKPSACKDQRIHGRCMAAAMVGHENDMGKAFRNMGDANYCNKLCEPSCLTNSARCAWKPNFSTTPKSDCINELALPYKNAENQIITIKDCKLDPKVPCIGCTDNTYLEFNANAVKNFTDFANDPDPQIKGLMQALPASMKQSACKKKHSKQCCEIKPGTNLSTSRGGKSLFGQGNPCSKKCKNQCPSDKCNWITNDTTCSRYHMKPVRCDASGNYVPPPPADPAVVAQMREAAKNQQGGPGKSRK